jgi:hypothetical protein
MTNEDLILLSRFAFGLRKITGNRVEVARFVAERGYAKGLLDIAEEYAERDENIELMLLTLKLRQKVGLMAEELPASTAPAAQAPLPATRQPSPDDTASGQKYVGRLR